MSSDKQSLKTKWRRRRKMIEKGKKKNKRNEKKRKTKFNVHTQAVDIKIHGGRWRARATTLRHTATDTKYAKINTHRESSNQTNEPIVRRAHIHKHNWEIEWEKKSTENELHCDLVECWRFIWTVQYQRFAVVFVGIDNNRSSGQSQFRSCIQIGV